MATYHPERPRIRKPTALQRLDALESALAKRGTLLRRPGILVVESRPVVAALPNPNQGDIEMASKPKEPAKVSDVREWARENGIDVASRGRLKPEVIEAFTKKTKREVV